MPTTAAHNDKTFKWSLPTHFNFAGDVVDRWAEDAERLALICVDATGAETRWTYAEIAKRSAQLAHAAAHRRVANRNDGCASPWCGPHSLHHHADTQRHRLSRSTRAGRRRHHTVR